MKIEGSIALVTGANRGLGQALVTALINAGAAKIYACARDERTLSKHARVVPMRLDTSNAEQLAAAAKQATDVTLLINNAGVMRSLNVLTTEPAALESDMRTNVYGTLAAIKAFLPTLEKARGGATIVNVLSLTSLASFPAIGGYSASKAAAYSITQALRAELRPKHIALLAALPGPIDTDMVKGLALPKSAPADTARGVLEGIERGEEEIFPDPMGQQLRPLWSSNPKEFERAFANL